MQTAPLPTNPLSRRRFLQLSGLSAAGLLLGCAVNPVTGRQQLMLVSEASEIQMDRQRSPFQFSADYGALQDHALNAYINRTGLAIAKHTQRPNMPYSFRGVNAVYANAYAFPGGSIAVTRGMLIELENEAELAALLGHELGHVNARHTAQQMSKGMLSQLLVSGLSIYAASYGRAYGDLASQIGSLGAGALLASYSRDNERQADALGMEYVVRSGYSPRGMIELLEILKRQARQKGSATELLFATHPMSDERYRTAVERAATRYAGAMGLPLYRQRFMDHTVHLRSQKAGIRILQKAQSEMARQNFSAANALFARALKQLPHDYAGLLMTAKCKLAQTKPARALPYARAAKQVYPQEAQAYFVSGYAELQLKRYAAAYTDFSQNERLLPGNPQTLFYKGYALEGMHRRQAAARAYYRYLQTVHKGKLAAHAYRRLVQWGYLKP